MRNKDGVKFEEKETDSIDKMEILKEHDIVSFDIGLTSEEKRGIAEVIIEKELPQFDYYGPIGEELVENLTTYFRELGENEEKIITTISKLVARVAEMTIKDFHKESAWVMVRVSLPNDYFDVPRWHSDGQYFETLDSADKTYKLVMTIKGAPTRFGEKIDPERFDQLMIKSSKNYELNHNEAEVFEREDMRIRRELSSIIREAEPLKEGEAAYYLVGHENAKIHSEPIIDTPRIFMSVVPGSINQVGELKERWNKKITVKEDPK